MEPKISHQCNPKLDYSSCSGELKEQKTHPFPLSGRGVSVLASPGQVLAGGWGMSPVKVKEKCAFPASMLKIIPGGAAATEPQEGQNHVLL